MKGYLLPLLQRGKGRFRPVALLPLPGWHVSVTVAESIVSTAKSGASSVTVVPVSRNTVQALLAPPTSHGASTATTSSLLSVCRQLLCGVARASPTPPPAPGKRAEKKVDQKTGGGGGDDEEDSSNPLDDPSDPVVSMLTRIVTAILFGSFVLWLCARPSGRPVGWATLREKVGEIDAIVVYDNYAQVFSKSLGAMYVGLADSENTERHVSELRQAYQEGKLAYDERILKEQEAKPKKKSQKAAPEGEEGEAVEEEAVEEEEKSEKELFSHPELPVVLKGQKWSVGALNSLGTIAWIVPFVFFPVYVTILSRFIVGSIAQASMGQTAQKAKMTFKVEPPADTRFRDVAGMKEPKAEITEIVDFLKHPKRYTDLGAKIPAGALLLGPPGTGKTLLAKAVSGESGVSFIPVCGSDFVELYAGMGAKRVRELFTLAKKQRCIIYIDEIDAIGLKRQGAGHGEKQETEHTLNELLTQLDGFASEQRAGDIILLASSNVALESLDPALVRPGRFDRIIHVDSPVLKERVEIFKVHLAKLKLVSDEFPVSTSLAAVDPPKAEKTETAEEPKKEGTEGEGKDATKKEETLSTTSTLSSSGSPPLSTSTALVVSPPPITAEEWVSQFASNVPKGKVTTTEENTNIGDEKKGPIRLEWLEAESNIFKGKSKVEQQLMDAYAHRMSDLCPGFVGSDIANVCNEAAILAAQEKASFVTIRHLERSIDRVLAGIEHRSRVLSPFEKEVVAHHEAGHAVAGWFLNRASPLMKVSIVPRGGSALGYAQYLPDENLNETAAELRDSISVTLGGRIAEDIFFHHLSTGASDDLRKVGRMAYRYVARFNPDWSATYRPPTSEAYRYKKPYGDAAADRLDQLAMALVNEIYADTHALLTRHKEDMQKLAQHLLRDEVLTHHDVIKYLGPRPERDRERKKLSPLPDRVAATA